MPGEESIAGILAQQKLQERERLEVTQKIEGIDKKVADVQKNFQEGLAKVELQIKSVATSRGDSEILKKWPTLTDGEKAVSPLIPRNAFATMLEAIFAEPENIPGLKRQIAELYTPEDAEKLLSEDPTGEKFAEAICTNEACRTKVKERVEVFSKDHGLKKEKKFFLDK